MKGFIGKQAKKIGRIVVSSIVCMSIMTVGISPSTLESHAASNHWATPYLNNLMSQGVMRGDSSGGLYPDRPITRAEFVAMMNRAFGYTEKGVAKFKDVSLNSWYYDDIRVASQVGYFQGSGKSEANPEAYLKREEAVTMLCRALKIEGIDEDNFAFADSKYFSNWSKDFINASVQKDFLSGYPDGTFKPATYMKRGEMAKVLSEVAGNIVNRQGNNAIGYTSGNVSLIKSGAHLLNTTIPGDLYITAGADLGYTKLENVEVKGDLIVSGTGESQEGDDSIIFSNCDINNLIIDSVKGKTISLKAEDDTDISRTIVKSSAFLQEDESNRRTAFKNVILNGNKGVKLNLAGDFEDVTVLGEGNNLILSKGYAERITVDEKSVGSTVLLDNNTEVGDVFLDTATKITGNGKINAVIINTQGTSISTMPKNVIIRPGVTASVNGKPMTSQDAEINSRTPEFVSGYPKKDEVAPTSADILVKVNKPGKIYWIVRQAGTGNRLYAEDLIKPKKEFALKSGSIGAMADKEATLKVSGLAAGVEYEFVAVFVDMLDKSSYVETERFKTVDNVAPKFISGYPKVKTTDPTSVTLSVFASKNCDYYWVLLPEKSVNPTVDMVINQNVTGAVKKGITADGIQNVEKEIVINELQEYKVYDFYIVAKDSSNNKSNLVKVTVTTADKTPPQFKFGPVQGTATNNSVTVKYEVNEAGSLYWVAVKKGEQFPKPIPPATTPPALDSKEAADAVITGNNVDKKAKVSMTANKQGVFSVSGLEKERDYDLYIVLEDSFKNASAVTKISIKPSDTTPPTATLEFPDHINGKPLANSNIIMNFSEIVCDSDTGTLITEIVKSNPSSTSLDKFITLWDMSKNRPEKVTIDFSKAVVKEAEGKTSIVFGTNAIKLTSGNVYEFELNKLKDTSGNRMSDRTKLKQFSTVPPLVDFIGETADGKDIAFSIEPQENNTSNIIKYDTVLISNQNIKFKLLKKVSGKPTENFADYEFSLDKGRAYSIRYLIDRQKGKLSTYTFDQFNEVTDTIYEMEITEINENRNEKSWGETVTITAKGIIGDNITMTNAVNAIASGGISRLKEFTGSGSIFSVEYPADFTRTVIFSDTEVPTFQTGYPKFTPGETKIGIEVQAKKPAKMYYVAAKLDGNNPATEMPTPSQMEKGMTGKGIKSGSIDIPYGYYLTQGIIDGLDPIPSKYRVYYMLKGTMPEAGTIEYKDVTMAEIEAPTWLSMPIYDPGKDSVRISYKLNTDADVYWVVYQKDATFAGNSPTPSDLEIIEPKDDSTRKLIGHGKVYAEGGVMEEILCDGLELDKQYKFFAVAKKELGNKNSSIAEILHMVPLDLEPPYILALNPYIQYDELSKSYEGSVSVTFSEPVFYINDTAGVPKAFTKQVIDDNPNIIHSPAGTITVSHVSEMTVKDSIKAIKSIEISFDNFREGAYIKFPILGDAKNIVGELILTMRMDNSNPDNPVMIFESNW